MKYYKSNASEKSAYSFIVGETSHTSNQSQKAIEQQVEVLSSTPQYPQRPYQPTAYDYLALIPGILAAATPLLLGWLQRWDKDKKN